MTNPTPEMVEKMALELCAAGHTGLKPESIKYIYESKRIIWDEVARFVLAREAQAHQAGLREAAEIVGRPVGAGPRVDSHAQSRADYRAILAAAQGEK